MNETTGIVKIHRSIRNFSTHPNSAQQCSYHCPLCPSLPLHSASNEVLLSSGTRPWKENKYSYHI